MSDTLNTATPASSDADTWSVDKEVRDRYAEGAQQVVPALCCPTDYDAQYLKILPAEILEKDYGCGDPSKWVGEGDTVIDLGSGAGKICYILSQKVGAGGNVIGVDFNDAMLDLAQKYQDEMAQKIGHANVRFAKGKIQDMKLDLAKVQEWLDAHPVRDVEGAQAFEAECDRLREQEPLVVEGTADAVVSNCVLNLVKTDQKAQLIGEIFRVLKPGGRAVISDIVCDEDPTEEMMNDADLWSGCISGAFREDRFLAMFEEAGFYGVEILSRASEPWHVIDGIEFRSMTIRAYKSDQAPCMEHNQAVVYKGPWKQIRDDDAHVYLRGERMAVCAKTFAILTDGNGPYAGQFEAIEPIETIRADQAKLFDCKGAAIRHPRQTKGEDYRPTVAGGESCCDDGECC